MKLKPFLVFALSGLIVSSPALSAEGGWFGKKKTEETPKTVEKKAASAAVAVQAQASATAPAPAAAQTVLAAETPEQAKQRQAAVLSGRMANNKSMTEDQKMELAETAQKYFDDSADLRDKAYEKDVLFFEQVSNDPNMKIEEKKAAIQKYFSEPRAAEAASKPVLVPAPKPVLAPAPKLTPKPALEPASKPAPKAAPKPAKIPEVEIKAVERRVAEVKDAPRPVPIMPVIHKQAPAVQKPTLVTKSEIKPEIKQEAKAEVKKNTSNFAKKSEPIAE